MKAVHLSDDFRVELFAAEPQVMNQWRWFSMRAEKIYVAEMMDYPDDPLPSKPIFSRIRLLEEQMAIEKTTRPRYSLSTFWR